MALCTSNLILDLLVFLYYCVDWILNYYNEKEIIYATGKRAWVSYRIHLKY